MSWRDRKLRKHDPLSFEQLPLDVLKIIFDYLDAYFGFWEKNRWTTFTQYGKRRNEEVKFLFGCVSIHEDQKLSVETTRLKIDAQTLLLETRQIKSKLESLKNLTALSLCDCKMSTNQQKKVIANLPVAIQNLSLVGSICFMDLTRLSNLKTLDVEAYFHHTELTVPPSLQNLTLVFSNDKSGRIVGSVPTKLKKLSFVQLLDGGFGKTIQPYLDAFSNTRIHHLQIECTHFGKVKLPVKVSRLSLFISTRNNVNVSTISNSLTNLKELTHIGLCTTKSEVLSTIKAIESLKLKNLTSLELSYVELNKSMAKRFISMRLKALILFHSDIVGSASNILNQAGVAVSYYDCNNNAR